MHLTLPQYRRSSAWTERVLLFSSSPFYRVTKPFFSPLIQSVLLLSLLLPFAFVPVFLIPFYSLFALNEWLDRPQITWTDSSNTGSRHCTSPTADVHFTSSFPFSLCLRISVAVDELMMMDSHLLLNLLLPTGLWREWDEKVEILPRDIRLFEV